VRASLAAVALVHLRAHELHIDSLLSQEEVAAVLHPSEAIVAHLGCANLVLIKPMMIDTRSSCAWYDYLARNRRPFSN